MNQPIRVTGTAPSMFTPYYVIPAEGNRLGLTTCKTCGASVVIDDGTDYTRVHLDWHHSRNEGMEFFQ